VSDGWVEHPLPTRMLHWLDADGCRWRRIGHGELSWKIVRRMIFDDSVEVVLFYGPEPKRVIGQQARRELWSRVEPVLRGRGEVPHQDFAAVPFQDAQERLMLAIEEHC